MENTCMTVRSEKYRARRKNARRRICRLRRRLSGGLLLAAALLGFVLWQGSSEDALPGPHQAVSCAVSNGEQYADSGMLSGARRTVTLIRQNPELPNGCEVTSMAMVLGTAGCLVDKLTLYGYLPREPIIENAGGRFGPDPELAYAGDATERTGGWYCFEGPVMEAANRWLTVQGSALRAVSLTGLGRTELEGYAKQGVPVVCWVTLSYAPPQRSEYTWMLPDEMVYRPYRNLHCVVLTGVGEGKYRVADPLSGSCEADAEAFWDSFDAMGRRAVVIM